MLFIPSAVYLMVPFGSSCRLTTPLFLHYPCGSVPEEMREEEPNESRLERMEREWLVSSFPTCAPKGGDMMVIIIPVPSSFLGPSYRRSFLRYLGPLSLTTLKRWKWKWERH